MAAGNNRPASHSQSQVQPPVGSSFAHLFRHRLLRSATASSSIIGTLLSSSTSRSLRRTFTSKRPMWLSVSTACCSAPLSPRYGIPVSPSFPLFAHRRISRRVTTLRYLRWNRCPRSKCLNAQSSKGNRSPKKENSSMNTPPKTTESTSPSVAFTRVDLSLRESFRE